MANLRLYFELLSKKLTTTEQGTLGYALPPFRQEDILELEISLLRQISFVRAPLYELVNLSGFALRVSVGTALGTAMATQATFSIDSTGTKLTGTLNLNVAAINALADGTSLYFELIATDASGTYGKRFTTTYEKALFTAGTLVAQADDVALGRAEALRLYVKKEGSAGEGFIMTADNGTQAFVYLDNDGQLRASPIS